MPTELYAGLIEATLATTAALLLVLALRRPLRSFLGARIAYGLWGLVPAALLATLLPAANVPVRWQTVATILGASATPGPILAPTAPVIDDAGLCLLWLCGALAVAL